VCERESKREEGGEEFDLPKSNHIIKRKEMSEAAAATTTPPAPEAA